MSAVCLIHVTDRSRHIRPPPPPRFLFCLPSFSSISFTQMTTVIAIEDLRREVKILLALTGHRNLVQCYESYEDDDNVYVVMEGGKYSEEDAKAVMVQILSVTAYCHLQGVVHRDLKPEV